VNFILEKKKSGWGRKKRDVEEGKTPQTFVADGEILLGNYPRKGPEVLKNRKVKGGQKRAG